MRSRSGSAATRSASWRSWRRARVADGADTLITAGGVQSNHARATAAAAAKLGMRAVLVANGERAGAADRQRAARRSARRRGRLRRRRARSATPTMLDDRRAPAQRGPPAVRDSDRRVDAARRARLRARDGRARRSDAGARRHRPLDFVWRHAGRPRRRLPAARSAARASSASAPTIRPRRCRRRSRAIVSGIADLLDLDPDALARGTRDRGRRSLRRRRLRHPDRRVARGHRARRAHRGDLPRSDLHRQGDGRPDRVRPSAEIQGKPDGAVLAHRRAGRACSREAHRARVPSFHRFRTCVARASGVRTTAP